MSRSRTVNESNCTNESNIRVAMIYVRRTHPIRIPSFPGYCSTPNFFPTFSFISVDAYREMNGCNFRTEIENSGAPGDWSRRIRIKRWQGKLWKIKKLADIESHAKRTPPTSFFNKSYHQFVRSSKQFLLALLFEASTKF